jgi:5-methylcytosine-specific restriction protein A
MTTSTKAPLGYCPTPECKNRSNGKCPSCRVGARKATDAHRGSRHARGYGSAWDRTSARWKATHPLCGMRADLRLHPEHSQCAQRGLHYAGGDRNPLVTDHIIPREQGGTDTEDNFQTLCHTCHSIKTATENGGIQRDA